ncbi:unnamed protein product [Protopolystoma xenopodis]|uniref:Uncharacterized protein n=1 Tax=Protopolystoma xenopodis TaxID=117903 RepID=A0A3S5B7D7_9PLAT|nr:unnamed protein product [Protopolystoma xenopodis]
MATSSILTNTTTSDFLASDGPDFDDEDGEVDYIDELDNSIGSRGSTGSGGRLFSTNMTNSGSVSAACANATSTALNSSWMQQIMDRSCNPELRALLNRTARAVDYKLAFGGDYSLASPLSRANGGILYANAKDVKNNEPYSEEKQSNIILAHMKRSASQGNFLATASLSGISSDIDKAIVKKYQDENCMISANVRSVGVTANASLSIDPLGHNLVKLGIPVNETNKVDSGLLPSKNIEAQPSQTTTWARKRGSRESLTRKQTGMDAIAFVPPPSECFSEESHADKMPNMTAWKVMKQAASSNLTTWSELKKTARRSKSTDIQHAVDGHQSRLDQHKLNIAFGHVSQEPESKVEVGETFMPNNLRSRSQPTSIDMHRFSGTLLEIFMRARAQDMLYSTLFDAKQRRPSNASGRHSSAASPSLHELAILAGACDLGPTRTDACSTRPRGWFDGLFSNNSLSAASTHAVSSSPANFVPKIQQPLITSYNLSIRAPTRANVASSGAIRPCSNFGAQFPPLDATGKALLAASGGSLLPGPPRGFPIFAIAPGLTTGKRASGGVYYPTSSARHPIIRQARPLSTNALGSGGGLSAAFQPLAPQQATGVMASFSRRRASQGGFQPNSPLATGLASNSLGLSPSLFTRPLVSCLTASAGPDSACMTALRLGVHPHHYAHPATAAGVATGASTMAGLSSHCFGGVGTRNPRAAIAYPGVGLLAIPRPSRMTACAFLSHTLPDLSFLGQAAAEEDRKGTPTMPKRMEVSVTETPSFAPNRPAKFNKPAQPPCEAESLSPAASAGCHHVCQKCGGCSRSASASASHLATTNTSSSSSSLVASGRRASRPSQTVSVGPRRSQPAGRVPTSSIVEASDRNKALETATISAGELQDKPESENLSGGLLFNERYRSFPELALAVAGTSGEEALQDCNRLAMIEHRTPCRAKFDGDSMLHSDPIKVSHFKPFDANCIILLRINH